MGKKTSTSQVEAVNSYIDWHPTLRFSAELEGHTYLSARIAG